MANIPALPQLTAELLKESPETFVEGLNDFLIAVRNALSGDLTIGTNIAGQYNTKKIYVDDGEPPYPFAFEWNYPTRRPFACLVVNVSDAQGELRGVLSGINANFVFQNNKIVIKGLAGQLEPNKWYTFTFLTLAG